MALGSNQQTITTGANFIPEVWVNEVRAFLRASLVLADHVKMIPFEGRKGDTLHIPDVSELVTSVKAANTQVTLQSPTEDVFNLSITHHRESSFLIEDLLAIQNSYDLRSEYTKSAGYAIAKQLDTALGSLHSSLTTRVNGANATYEAVTAANAADITEAGLRGVIERLNTANVPDDGQWCLWIHPAQKNVLLAISRFTEYQMLGPGGMPIRTGQFGEIFGVPVYVSTQQSVTGSANPGVSTGTGTAHANFLLHRDAIALAVQSSPRIQAQYKLEYLGWLFVVDVVYGYGIFRQSSINGIYTPQ